MTEVVLQLYKDCSLEVLRLMENALRYLEFVDRENYFEYCEALYNLKQEHPEFMIELVEGKNSCFECDVNKVYLEKGRDNFVTFFHELTHVFHYYRSGFMVPSNALEVMEKTKMADDFDEKCLTLIQYTKQMKNIIFEQMDLKSSENEEDEQIILKLAVLDAVEDIVDALNGGRSYEQGLCLVRDMNSYGERTTVSAGHGEQYFGSYTDSVYIEIIANYGAIKNSEFKEEIFKILNLSFGNEFISCLESCYKELMMSEKVFNMDNIVKKNGRR